MIDAVGSRLLNSVALGKDMYVIVGRSFSVSHLPDELNFGGI